MTLPDFLAVLPDPKSSESMGWIVGALAAVAVAANQIMGFVEKMRRREPNADNLQAFARRDEFERERQRVDVRLTALEKSLDDKFSAMLAEMRSINRSLGRLEGNSPGSGNKLP